MTSEEFIAFYPQFSAFASSPVLTEYVRQANARFASFGDDAEEARRLFTAHKLTRYLTTVPTSEDAPRTGGAAGLPAEGVVSSAALVSSASTQKIASQKVGEVSVAYASGTSSVSGAFADLTETVYGAQLFLLLRLHAMTEYVP